MAKLTPALLDLMEHEKVIDQGLGTFIDVGNALAAIRDGEKWRALEGCDTFEDYCETRWGLKRTYAHGQIAAAAIVEVLSANADGSPLLVPSHESQVRPLVSLRRKPDLLRDVWADAIDLADGGQPTADEVKTAKAKRIPTRQRVHPARFSNDVFDVIAVHVAGTDKVLDPFAGTGRVHELRERGILETVGVEIEPEWAALHSDTIEGDALALPFPDASVPCIATSPTYGNRMADHHDATDVGERNTYKHTLGHDLHEHNSGQLQWGDEYRDFHERAWAEAVRVLEPGGVFVLNIKDHIRDGVKQEVAAWHLQTLIDLGLRVEAIDVIPTRGVMAGENAEVRTCAEIVVKLRKP